MYVFTMQYIRVTEFLRNLRDREEGQGLVEYGLILALISVVVVGTLATIGTDVKGVFEDVIEELT